MKGAFYSGKKGLALGFWILCLFLGSHVFDADARQLKVPASYPTIQDAIRDSWQGDTIVVAPGRYSVAFDSLIIPKEWNITIKSEAGAQETVISGRGNSPIIVVGEGSGAVIEGFTLVREGDLKETLKGGAIYCAPGSAPVIKANIIRGNHATFGGGIFCDVQSKPTIVDNVFLTNSAKVAGGAIFTDRARALIARNRFHENSARVGGALASNRDSSQVSNNIFWKNRAVYGGAAACDRAATIFDNDTFAYNSAEKGSAIMVEKGSVRLTNLIVWYNEGVSLVLRGIGPAARPAYCDLQDGVYKGINGNISARPMFVDGEEGDFHLLPSSPCINKGCPDPYYMDKDGSYNDMGAYGGPSPLVDSKIPYKGR
ncbi:MAG: DUF1565 domain-containing protein [Thermodesulfobacteria bacterium]|nr:DUF1565 domain-containing protein [Thermodesulfobacteriota bacterium]